MKIFTESEKQAFAQFLMEVHEQQHLVPTQQTQVAIEKYFESKTATLDALWLMTSELKDKLTWLPAEVSAAGTSPLEVSKQWLRERAPALLLSTVVNGQKFLSVAHKDRIVSLIATEFGNVFSLDNLDACAQILLREIAAEDAEKRSKRQVKQEVSQPGRASAGLSRVQEQKPPTAEEVARNEQLLERTAKSAQAFVLASLQSPPGGVGGKNHGVKEQARKAMSQIIRELTSQPVKRPDGTLVEDRQSAYYKGAVCRAWVECAKRITSEVIENPEYGGSRREIR